MQVPSVLWKRDWYFYNTIFETLLLTSKCFNSFKKGIKALGLKITKKREFSYFCLYGAWLLLLSKNVLCIFASNVLQRRDDSDFRAKKLQLNGGIIENEGSKKS